MNEYLTLEQHGHVSVLTLNNGENRWTTNMVRELNAALDEVEQTSGPQALVTASSDSKFFSNGLDLDWITSKGEHEGGDRKVFGDEAVKLFSRLITFPIPTIAAVNGHAFGAGFMWALCHDQRVMRRDRGMMCANEVEIGMAIPEPELALFHHKLPRHAFYETVQFAKRWTGEVGVGAWARDHGEEAVPLIVVRPNGAVIVGSPGQVLEIKSGDTVIAMTAEPGS